MRDAACCQHPASHVSSARISTCVVRSNLLRYRHNASLPDACLHVLRGQRIMYFASTALCAKVHACTLLPSHVYTYCMHMHATLRKQAHNGQMHAHFKCVVVRFAACLRSVARWPPPPPRMLMMISMVTVDIDCLRQLAFC